MGDAGADTEPGRNGRHRDEDRDRDRRRKHHPFLGPSRADFMQWIADTVGMRNIGDALVKAELRSQYGDAIKFDERPTQIAGGDIRHESCECVPPLLGAGPGRRRPKIGWVLAALAVGALWALSLFALWLALSRPPAADRPRPAPGPAPGPAPSPRAGDAYDVSIFEP